MEDGESNHARKKEISHKRAQRAQNEEEITGPVLE
jgi:hypothetical protein